MKLVPILQKQTKKSNKKQESACQAAGAFLFHLEIIS